MSRCLQYPPPGYIPSRANKEALIESIKLQKEVEKTKARNKQEKRRVKEDLRKERKDEKNEMIKPTDEKTDWNSKKRRKREEGKREEGREEKNRIRKDRNEKHNMNSNKVGLPNGPIGKNIWENSEQLERSVLTEEHDQPICSHFPSTSFESTENSSTRKRQSSPVNEIRGHGTIIRIKLSSKKLNLSDISLNEQLCSTSGRTDVPPLINGQQNFCASTVKTSDFVIGNFNRTDKKQIISTSGKSEPAAPAKAGTRSVLDVMEVSKKSSKTMQYKNLIENWVQPSLLEPPSPEDLDWLFCSKDHGLQPERRQKIKNDGVFCSSSSSLFQPRAQFLPEVDVYALPYSVPY